jgi:hypothetical protein
MGYAVPGAAIPDTESAAGAAQKKVIIGVPVIFLNQVVIHVLAGKLGFHSVEPHSLEPEHHQSAGSVLSQGLVYFQSDLLPRFHLAFDKVARD